MKKIIAIILSVCILCSTAGCYYDDPETDETFKASMVTDTGGVNDQSFNMSAWEGLQSLSQKTGASVGYIESTQATDYLTNLDKLADQNCDLVFGIGFAMGDALRSAALINPAINYALVDNSYSDEEMLDNITGIVFKAQESSFLVGYIAAKTTETDMIGFVGGIESVVIDQFEYGYRAGIAYGAKELGKDIKVVTQYAESFSDAAKGKAIATKMISDGCDIIFHAAGGVGMGVIEAVKESNKFVIGVDRDQAYLAPNNVLTSSLKMVGSAVEIVATDKINGKDIGGQTFTYGLKENCVGIPENNPNMDPEVYKDAMKLKQKIIDGDIIVPSNNSEYQNFKP